MPTFDSVQVTGNATVQGDMQVNGNESIGMNLQVAGSETILGHLQVNNSLAVMSNLAVGNTISSGSSMTALFRLISTAAASLPVGTPSLQQLRYYASGSSFQPGLVLKGTDGNDYVLFVDASSGTPHLGIQRM